jgi:DNA mismatch repair protein MutL
LAHLQRPAPEQSHLAMDMYRPGDRPSDTGPFVVPETPPERLPMLRVLGQVAQTYIIAEGPGGMYLIDQHAAHERIRYEELRAQRERMGIATQELLDPLPIELSPQQATLLEAHTATLATFGVAIEPFGGNTYLVKRVPAGLADGDIIAAVMELLDAAAQGGEAFSWEDQILITLSCHTAVRAGRTLSIEEQRDLVRQLERAALPHTCPHGRPTMIHLSQEQLEKEFGRR